MKKTRECCISALKRLRQLNIQFILLIATMFAFAATDDAEAHPMGKFAICHFAAIRAHSDSVKIHYIVDFAEIPTYQKNKAERIDANGDRIFSRDEVDAYLPKVSGELLRGLELKVDGEATPLNIVSSKIEMKDGLPGLKTLWVELELEAPIEYKAWRSRNAVYKDNNFSDHGGWKEIKLFGSEKTAIIKSTPLSGMDSRGLTDYPKELAGKPPADTSVSFAFGPGKSETLYVADGGADNSATRGADSSASGFQKLVKRLDIFKFIEKKKLDPPIIAVALLFAFLAGCAHALQPGHGKTLVAAYLVGTTGKASDALKLGLIVTLTHVAAVIAVFAALITFWSHINPEKVYPWLGVGSGLIILIMGVWIIYRNATGRLLPHEHDEHGRHVVRSPRGGHGGHDHHHPHSDGSHSHHGHTHDHHAAHVHDHSHAGSHHDHHYHESHSHEHGHSHDHSHEHHHGHYRHHDHHHDDHIHKKENVGAVKFFDLMTLGITGGIVPCPTAIMILIASIGLKRIVFGLALTVSFSVGMAAALIFIGLMVVKAKSFAGETLADSGAARFLPYISGTIISLIGMGILARGLSDLQFFVH